MRERVGGARSERPGRIPIVYALSRLAPGGQAVALGVLVVLLTPCIDYVIVFTRLAGGSDRRLLAASPLLMLSQMALLPVYLAWAARSPTGARVKFDGGPDAGRVDGADAPPGGGVAVPARARRLRRRRGCRATTARTPRILAASATRSRCATFGRSSALHVLPLRRSTARDPRLIARGRVDRAPREDRRPSTGDPQAHGERLYARRRGPQPTLVEDQGVLCASSADSTGSSSGSGAALRSATRS
jgi:hypothetical protein